MPKIDHKTKQNILIAAEEVFHLHGLKGARTTLIAEKAGISRTMLHYYYSTKEALFEEVLHNTLSTILQHFQMLLGEKKDLISTIDSFVNVLFDLFDKKPNLPTFLINLLNELPNISVFLSAAEGDDLPAQFQRLVEEAHAKGEIAADVNGEDLLINIYALCSAAYLFSPYIKAKERRTDEEMLAFARGRRASIRNLILKGILPNKEIDAQK